MSHAARFGALYIFGFLGVAAAADDVVVDAIVAAYESATAPVELPVLDMPRAVDIQHRVADRLRPRLGVIVGYKAALTSPATQAAFDVTGPVVGILLAGMLYPQGTVFKLANGVDLWLEADLLLRVGDPSINQAQTRSEMAGALDAVIPFVEVPDRLGGRHARLDGAALTAINAGARYGVTGSVVNMAVGLDWEKLLAGLRVAITDGEGRLLAVGSGAAALGHPLTVVRKLRDELRSRGRRLRVGDLVSVGALASPLDPEPGTVYRVSYAGLGAHPLTVTIGFQ